MKLDDLKYIHECKEFEYVPQLEARLRMACELLEKIVRFDLINHSELCTYDLCLAEELLAKLKSEGLY